MDTTLVLVMIWQSVLTLVLTVAVGFLYFVYRIANESKWEGRRLRARLNSLTDIGDEFKMGPVDHTLKAAQRVELSKDIMKFIDDSEV